MPFGNDRRVRTDAAPPPPAGTIGIGVTGHRPERLGSADLAALHVTVSDVLGAIVQAAGSAGSTRFRLISALAEGADSIVADAALERGWPLDAVLPFFREDYAGDFAAGLARDAHGARLAHARTIFELPGDRIAEGGAAAAYERAGRIVLSQSDLLLAIWDGGPVRGRGGAAQVVAEAVLRGIPVIRIDPAGAHPPALLWDGLEEADLGQQTVDTVAQADLGHLDGLFHALLAPPAAPDEASMLARFRTGSSAWRVAALAYPLLLAVMGVRRPHRSDLGIAARGEPPPPALSACAATGDFADRLERTLLPRFVHADEQATYVAALFRSGYVGNFTLAALAVILAMLGLALPAAAKPALIAAELVTIGVILVITYAGNRARWHRRWLDNRALAERLRALALSAQLGELDLRDGTPPWVGWYVRATSRELGLPSARADESYMTCIRQSLLTLMQGQIAYLAADERRMHRLDHRLHVTGTVLFALTALACLTLLVFKMVYHMTPGIETLQTPLTIAVTIMSAALPAIGAAIYGIRMQGDFAGVAARSERLRHDLTVLQQVVLADAPGFDTLNRRVRRAADLLAGDLSSWFQTYRARPLALPG